MPERHNVLKMAWATPPAESSVVLLQIMSMHVLPDLQIHHVGEDNGRGKLAVYFGQIGSRAGD